MRYSGSTERDEQGPWFSLGQLEVTTTVLVVLLWAVGVIIWAGEGPSRSITSELVLSTDQVATGEAWRLFTWPFSHSGFGLWDIINAAVFWYFGSDLERQTGRRAFAWIIGASTVAIGLAATLLGTVLSSPTVLYDIDLLGLTVILLYIAEHPQRPFFFGIPAWVIGAVIVTLELVNDIGNRDWTRLLAILLASGVIAVVAKRNGLLLMYDQIPDLKLPGADARAERKAAKPKAARGKSSGSAKPSGGLAGKFGRREEAEIVAMPTAPQRPRRMPVVPDDVSADDLALDALLDKISAGGIDSLSEAERKQLDEIRERRRQD